MIKLNFTHNFFEKEILSINQGFKKFSMHFPLAFLHVSIPSQGTDTVNKKLAVFTYVYFFVTEAQKSSKNKNHQPQLKNLTVSYIKKLISSVGRYRRDLYLLCYHDLRNSRKF